MAQPSCTLVAQMNNNRVVLHEALAAAALIWPALVLALFAVKAFPAAFPGGPSLELRGPYAVALAVSAGAECVAIGAGLLRARGGNGRRW